MNKFKCIIIAAICLVFATVFIIRFAFKPEPMITETITVSGITDGIGIKAGQELEDVFVSVPDILEAEELISVTSDGNIAILKLQTPADENERIIKATVIGKGVGVAEVYVMSPDGEILSEKFTVNVFDDGNPETDTAVSDGTMPVNIENCVYVTPSGVKYHLSRKCAGSSATATELVSAVENGYLPCKNCAMKK